MPRIDCIRVGRWLWVAVNVTDRNGYDHARLGFTAWHATSRCHRALTR